MDEVIGRLQCLEENLRRFSSYRDNAYLVAAARQVKELVEIMEAVAAPPNP